MTDVFDPFHSVEDMGKISAEGEVVELPLLLPGWQVTKLETVAHEHGMTAAAMVRHLLGNFLTVAPLRESASSP